MMLAAGVVIGLFWIGFTIIIVIKEFSGDQDED